MCKTGLDKSNRDLWLWPALGHGAARTYEGLTLQGGGPVRAADLSRQTGVSYAATRRHLALFVSYGMAERSSAGWVARPFDITAVSKALGSHEATEQLRERHKRERQGWRDSYIKRHGRDPDTGELMGGTA